MTSFLKTNPPHKKWGCPLWSCDFEDNDYEIVEKHCLTHNLWVEEND